MEYWNSLLTEKSWTLLQELVKKPIQFTLIGGWAAYMWTKIQKSKDLDIVLDNVEGIEWLKHEENLNKNESLRKYEVRYGEIDVDVYTPYYSRLAIPPEDVSLHSTTIEGFKVASPEALCILKQGAEMNRSQTVKGLKDRIDIMSLLCNTDFSYDNYKNLTKKYDHADYTKRLHQIATSFREGEYIGYNPRQLKLKKKEILVKLRKT